MTYEKGRGQNVSLHSDRTTGRRGGRTALGIGGGLAALALLGTVAGCSSSKTSNSTAAASSTAGGGTGGGASAPDSAAAGSGAAGTAPAATGDGPFAFGQTYSGGGETLSVSAPTAFTPTATAAGATKGDGGYYVTVRLANTGTTALDVSLLQLNATVGASGAKASNIIDSGTASLGSTGGSASPFAGSIAPGAAETGVVAFDVPAADKGAFVVEVDNLTQHLQWKGRVS